MNCGILWIAAFLHLTDCNEPCAFQLPTACACRADTRQNCLCGLHVPVSLGQQEMSVDLGREPDESGLKEIGVQRLQRKRFERVE